MSSVDLPFEPALTLTSFDSDLRNWFFDVEQSLVFVKGLSGLSGLKLVTIYEASWSAGANRNSTLTHEVELQARTVKRSLDAFADQIPQDRLEFMSVKYRLKKIVMTVTFKDPNKAVLFKLAKP